jgi:1,4-alpha-glucan branching enzyme
MLRRLATAQGRIVVTFRLPAYVAAADAFVVGDFNDWSPTATPMRRDESGWCADVTLSLGRCYRFRYLLDGARWVNDWDADEYRANEYGGEDSVVDLRAAVASERLSEGSAR